MDCEIDIECAKPTVLVLTRDADLCTVIRSALEQRSIKFQLSSSYDDVDNNFCLIIAGPDMDEGTIGAKLREAGGIPPCLLLLRNNLAETPPIRCCRCETLILPMDIFHLPRTLDELLVKD